MDERAFQKLIEFLQLIPAISGSIGTGANDNGVWWVKFSIDIQHEHAWRVVQELGHVLNYLSLNERLPTTFKPVSPAPYMNGGPDDFLAWIIECSDSEFRPGTCAEWLKSRLPNPVDDVNKWITE